MKDRVPWVGESCCDLEVARSRIVVVRKHCLPMTVVVQGFEGARQQEEMSLLEGVLTLWEEVEPGRLSACRQRVYLMAAELAEELD